MTKIKIFIFLALINIAALGQRVNIKFIETTDSHGAIYPFDFVKNKSVSSSLASVAAYVEEQREDTTQEVILLSGGDLLQGSPAVYYYNFEETKSPHLCADVMNYMKYDAAAVGNHDIEAGHKVYDKFREQLNFPWLGANAVKEDGITPYFQPYTILIRKGIKIAVLGLVTPYIPRWLPPSFYSGMEFQDMIESAKYWVKQINEKENPDILIGLFHSGVDFTYGGQDATTYKNENASLLVAEEVSGFDVVFVGHDHHGWNKIVTNTEGGEVLLLGGTSSAKEFAVADISVSSNGDGSVLYKKGYLLKSKNYEPDPIMLDKFSSQFKIIKKYVSQPLGKITRTISTRESFFGDSPFLDLIHNLQLEISGADISFAAPLSFDAEIIKGNIYVRDMFKLYRYENLLYTMKLTGKEIKDVLEFSYDRWFNRMKNEDDNLLNYEKDETGNIIFSKAFNQPALKQRFYNYESAEGIIYTVDVSKPGGERINVLTMNDGSPFHTDSIYTVAVSSYRGNGGGGHLTSGAGLSTEQLAERLVRSTDKDLRYYMMKWIEKTKVIKPKVNYNWKVLPEAWAKKGAKKDYNLLFKHEN